MSSPTSYVGPIPVGPDAVAAMSPSNYVTAEPLVKQFAIYVP